MALQGRLSIRTAASPAGSGSYRTRSVPERAAIRRQPGHVEGRTDDPLSRRPIRPHTDASPPWHSAILLGGVPGSVSLGEAVPGRTRYGFRSVVLYVSSAGSGPRWRRHYGYGGHCHSKCIVSGGDDLA